MKLTLLLITSIVLGIWLKPLSPSLYESRPALVTTVTHKDPPPTDAQVISYITHVFRNEDRHTIKKILDVAYAESGLRWNAENTNTNGTKDYGVFQINSIHTKRFGPEFKTKWTKNIEVAYQIYKEQGLRPWVASRKLGFVN